MAVSKGRLTVVDRTIIEVRLHDGWGPRTVAGALGWSAGTISDEIKRHSNALGYSATRARRQAVANRRLCGGKPRLASDGKLFLEIASLFLLGWSPEQISGRRKRLESGREVQSCVLVSNEAIYAAMYALPRGELWRELIACLRHEKPSRGRKPTASERRGKLCNMTNIR